ncbi:ECF transporter S component [Clostridiaceae bacterium M8S5]|nr:ECF transporter S component [Clostridiaceae bacterium M8S5]
MSRDKIRFIVFGGLCITLVFVATAIIPHIPVPFTEGYVNAGDSMIFISAILFGWKYGAIAGGLGSALADLYLEYPHWALPTLIIKGLMGLIVGVIAHNSNKRSMKMRVIVSGSLITVWIGLAFWIRTLLSGILKKPDITKLLIEKFELTSVGELSKMITRVEHIITIAIILIPLLIVTISILSNKKNEYMNINNMLGMSLAGVWMIIGYYFAGGILKGNMVVPIFSIPANILQFILGSVIAYLIVSAISKTNTINKMLDKN